jgi:hypothetical protein
MGALLRFQLQANQVTNEIIPALTLNNILCMLLDRHQQLTITYQIIPADPATRTTLNSNQHIRLLAIPCTLAGLLWALTRVP